MLYNFVNSHVYISRYMLYNIATRDAVLVAFPLRGFLKRAVPVAAPALAHGASRSLSVRRGAGTVPHTRRAGKCEGRAGPPGSGRAAACGARAPQALRTAPGRGPHRGLGASGARPTPSRMSADSESAGRCPGRVGCVLEPAAGRAPKGGYSPRLK